MTTRERPEALVLHTILKAYGAHPRLRIARVNVGVGWFAHGKPARKSDPGAYPVKFGVRGTPDICGIIRVGDVGVFLGIEVKAPEGAQRPEQHAMQRTVGMLGGLYILAYSLADVDREIEAFTTKLGDPCRRS